MRPRRHVGRTAGLSSCQRLAPQSEHTDRLTSAKVVAGSLLAGCLSAAALVAGPFAVSDEATTTGAILLGFAIGWALLAALSAWRGGGSHRWAAVPATVLGVSGLALVLLKPDGADARRARLGLAAGRSSASPCG